MELKNVEHIRGVSIVTLVRMRRALIKQYRWNIKPSSQYDARHYVLCHVSQAVSLRKACIWWQTTLLETLYCHKL